MLAIVILLQALQIMSVTSIAKKTMAACPKPDMLMKHALWEHNKRRSDLALGKVRTGTKNMWNAAFMMQLKENCLVTKKLKALKACSPDVFDRSIFGMRNTHTVEASSELSALKLAISHWWREIKRHPRPKSLQIEKYLTKHKHFLPMALSYQEYVSCSVNRCGNKHKKKRGSKQKYFVQCIYSEMPDRNQSLYEQGTQCSKYCYKTRGETCWKWKGLCYVPDQSNFIH